MAELAHTQFPRYESAVKSLLSFCFVLYFYVISTGPLQSINSFWFLLASQLSRVTYRAFLRHQIFPSFSSLFYFHKSHISQVFLYLSTLGNLTQDVTSSSCFQPVLHHLCSFPLISTGYIIFQTHTQILVVTPSAYTLHMDTPTSSMHLRCGTNLRLVYCRKQVHFLSFNSRNLCGISARASASCLLRAGGRFSVMQPTQFAQCVKAIFLTLSNNIIYLRIYNLLKNISQT